MRRNTVKTVSLILVMALVLGFASVASAAYTKYATQDLTVRSGPGSDYTALGSLDKGDSITATGKVVNGWAQVNYSQHEQGYVPNDYLSFYWPVDSGIVPGIRPDNSKPVYVYPSYSTGRGYLVVDDSRGDIYYATANLNLRSGPGTNYSVIGSISRNQQVTRIGKDGNWYKLLTSNGQSAYASSSYLEKVRSSSSSGSSSSSSSSGAAYSTYFTTTGLNVRRGPGTGYGIVTTLSRGEAVTYLGERSGDWYKIRTSTGFEGYCHSAYLTARTVGTVTGGGSTCIPSAFCGYCGRLYYGTSCTHCYNGKYWYGNFNWNYYIPVQLGWRYSVDSGATLTLAGGGTVELPRGTRVDITGLTYGSNSARVEVVNGTYKGYTGTLRFSDINY